MASQLDDLAAMALEYKRLLDMLGPDPTDEAIAAASEWNATHDWRAYRDAWVVMRHA